MDDHYDSGWGDRPPPLLRRPLVRGGITFFVVFTFLLLTLVSTCSPRTTRIGTTTTTIEGVTAFGELRTSPTSFGAVGGRGAAIGE